MKVAKFNYQFIETFPKPLEAGVIYVSTRFACAAHGCACGCGKEVISPLSPTDWQLLYDGASISLTPSIGNWSFPCRSHYWILRGRVEWSEAMSEEQIALGRARDRTSKAAYYGTADTPEAATRAPAKTAHKAPDDALSTLPTHRARPWWERLTGWMR